MLYCTVCIEVIFLLDFVCKVHFRFCLCALTTALPKEHEAAVMGASVSNVTHRTPLRFIIGIIRTSRTLYNGCFTSKSSKIVLFTLAFLPFRIKNRGNIYSIQPLVNIPRTWCQFTNENIKILRNKLEFKTELKKFLLAELASTVQCYRLLCHSCHLAL
jgi:hypothetical protein